MLLNVSIFVYMRLLVRTYICMFAYTLACIITYMHIFPLSVVGKRERRRKRMWEGKSWWGGSGKWIVAVRIISFSLILPSFMVAKGLFDGNMKCLFCGEFCCVHQMVIKLCCNFRSCIFVILSNNPRKSPTAFAFCRILLQWGGFGFFL